MADRKWSGYATIQTALSTGLNSLINDDTNISAAIDNTSNLVLFMDIEVYLGSVDLSAQSNPAIYIYVITSLDGTNYEDGDDSTVPPQMPTRIVALRVGVSAMTQRRVVRGIVVPPGLFKILAQNKTGVTLAATLNTVKYRTYYDTVN